MRQRKRDLQETEKSNLKRERNLRKRKIEREREKRKGTNESWNAETIWILSPLIPFFIPLKAPLRWRHSDLTSKEECFNPHPTPCFSPFFHFWNKLDSWFLLSFPSPHPTSTSFSFPLSVVSLDL